VVQLDVERPVRRDELAEADVVAEVVVGGTTPETYQRSSNSWAMAVLAKATAPSRAQVSIFFFMVPLLR
jgi:hypothetical protein